MDYFLFFILVRNLPVHSTLFGISNCLLCFICATLQLIISTLLIIFFHTQIPIILIFISLLIYILCLANQKSKFGFLCYYIYLIVTLGILGFWVKALIHGLDNIVFQFQHKNYKLVIEEIIIYHLVTGILLIFCVLFSFIVLTYSNELLFEEIKNREENRENHTPIIKAKRRRTIDDDVASEIDSVDDKDNANTEFDTDNQSIIGRSCLNINAYNYYNGEYSQESQESEKENKKEKNTNLNTEFIDFYPHHNENKYNVGEDFSVIRSEHKINLNKIEKSKNSIKGEDEEYIVLNIDKKDGNKDKENEYESNAKIKCLHETTDAIRKNSSIRNSID